ncbi:exportin-4-like isoform X2 [Harmonia axyridis]|uniref:exportin-4-like isoform X2 n=1 Tax=Harmonia axyridis TaxID=115357 RepID=UPI001E275000|nr:exportin-4-like isoform X2 [Harmonia axyridis]
MNESFMNELEGAARVIMAAPNLVTNEERRKAEQILLDFRNTKTPIRTCRQILEKSNVDYLHFEAAEVIKRGIVREWNFVSFSDKEDLINYLFNFVVTRDIPCFVRDKILIAISIMVKRISADDNGKQRCNLLNQVEDLINTAENSKKILGCQLILILMQEYATTCKSSDLGLPWEVHNKCKKQFENTDLIRIFKFVMGLLKDVTGIDTPFEPITAHFIKSLLQIAEQVMIWSYSSVIAPKRIVGQFESTRDVEDYPLLYFTVEWKEILLAPELVPLMFMIYWKVRYSEELSHHALTCLVQLASVTAKGMDGRKIYSEEARVAYVIRYLENFSKLISSVNIDGKEALGISSIAKKLCFCYHHEIAHGLSTNQQETFLEEMTTLTVYFYEKSVTDDLDDCIYEDSFRNMISVWCYLFSDYGKESKVALIKDLSIRIFSKYVQGRISPPNGYRKNITYEEEEILNENEEDSDRIKYKDQLQVIGIFGRFVLEYSLPILYKLLEYETEHLKSILQIMEVRALTLEESTRMESVFEDLHWTLIIAGHVLAMDSDGETPSIPSEVMSHSLRRMNMQSNLDATLKTLAKSQDLLWVNDCIDQCDDVIRIFSAALRLCVIEDSAASIKLGHFMSPLVSCSLMWFIKRFCMYYLVPNDSDHSQLSPIFMSTLGKHTEGANFIINFIISKVQNNIVNFYSEPVLLQDTVDLFGDIVSVKNKSQYFMSADNICSLINMQTELKPGHLPPEIRRGLYRGFALAGITFCQDPILMTQYMEKLFQPIQSRFNMLISNVKLNIHNEAVQNELIDILECLIGISKGAAMRSAQDIFNNMYPIMEAMVSSLRVYCNYQVIVQATLELMSQSARYMVCYLKHDQALKMFRYSIEFIKSYSNCQAKRLTSDKSAEESIIQDLSLILDILTYLLSKDYLDFCPSDNAENAVKASTHVMQGFCIIMPFLNSDMLKYPNLCLQYYRLLTHINDMCPKEICYLSNGVMMSILGTIEVGLSQFGPEITQSCLDFITRVCGYMFKHKLSHERIYEVLRPSVRMLLNMTLSNQINSDLLSSVGECMYLLMCCYPEEYEMSTNAMVQMQQDPMVSNRLAAAFERLLSGVEFDNERTSRVKFKSNFEKFVFHVQGFLLVK